MTLDIRALADRAMTEHPDHSAALRETTWHMVESDLTRFARAVLEEAKRAVQTWIASDEGRFAGVEEQSGAWSAIEVINSLLPSKPK